MKTYGIDANALTREKRTGVERYVFSLLKEMMREPLADGERVRLYASALIPDLATLPNGWSLQVLAWPPRRAWTHARLSWELWRRSPDVFYTPAHEIPLVHGKARVISTVHDVAFRIVPGAYPAKQVRRQEWAVKRAVNLSSRVLAVSQTTANDLVRLYRAAKKRLTVTPLAIEADRFQVTSDALMRSLHRYRLAPKRYFLTIGRLEAKKNIALLVDAFTEFKQRRGIGDPFELVLGGSFGYGEEEIKRRIRESSAKDFIKLIGYVPDADAPALMAGSAAYVFPTRYEGFGLPALEAQAAGTVLLASAVPALQEVAGDAALYADPGFAEPWAQLMHRVANGMIDRDKLIAAGAQNVKRFSWEQTAARTWRALRSA